MDTSSVTNSNPFAALTQSATGGANLKQEDFLKLMMTQLQTQSPLDPQDSKAMLDQMAQLSVLSTNQSLEKSLATLNSTLAANQSLQASAVVGRSVQVQSQVGVLNSDGLQGAVILPNNASEVNVVIKDINGKTVKEMALGQGEAGALNFKWDGIGVDGKAQNPGLYRIEASARINGDTVAVQTAATTKVESVSLNKDGQSLLLNLEGLGTIDIKNILKIL